MKIIDRVTVTGADDSVNPDDLVKIFEEYPFVEFGILLSKKWHGYKRFPSRAWLEKLHGLYQKEKIPLSGHLCGQFVRDFCLGENTFVHEYGFWEMFDRFQLNFHAEFHATPHPGNFLWVISAYSDSRQFIFQIDGVNDNLFELAKNNKNNMVVPLFDLSGGIGVLPEKWPEPDGYCGYAGGLSPDNLTEQLRQIARVVGHGPIWIDAETHLRSQDDMLFDLIKVRRFLEVAKPWVMNQI